MFWHEQSATPALNTIYTECIKSIKCLEQPDIDFPWPCKAEQRIEKFPRSNTGILGRFDVFSIQYV